MGSLQVGASLHGWCVSTRLVRLYMISAYRNGFCIFYTVGATLRCKNESVILFHDFEGGVGAVLHPHASEIDTRRKVADIHPKQQL